jgi:glycosyltransferase involved in cell wall biosynthesis
VPDPIRRVAVVMEAGGANRYWEVAIPLLKNHGFEPQLITFHPPRGLNELLEAEGVPTRGLGVQSWQDFMDGVFRLVRGIRESNLALIHCSESIAAALGGISAKLSHVPAIFHRHHCESRGKRAVFTAIASHTCDITMAVSHASAGFAIRENHVLPGRVKVAYNGIPPLRAVKNEETAAVRRSLEIPADAPVITMVARLRSVKGHPTLFKALYRVRAQLGKVPHVLLVGAGPEEEALRAQAAAIPDARFHWIGHTDDIALWFRAGDVAVMPSNSEGFGLVAIEAMSCDGPLVASAVGALPEVIEDGRSGLLVPPADPAALADSVVRVLSDADLRRQLVQGGLERYSRHFTVEAMVRGWVDCYRVVLSNTSAATGATTVAR